MRVRLTREAEADLDRLFDFVLERELARDGGDLSLAEQALVPEALDELQASLRFHLSTPAGLSLRS